jgi:hypothetical protein
MVRASRILFATTGAGLITVAFGTWHLLRFELALLIFVVLWIGCYAAGIWVNIRQAELDRKFPISSKERSRRTKEFYDWLRSQGRR